MTRDGALQLLLMVDYVVDWARDVYREDIITSLRSLASGDNDLASTFYPDTDIISTMETEILDLPSAPDEDQVMMEHSSSQRSFVACDSKVLAVRHGSFVESRFRCVLVTPDNVRTMLHLTQRHMTHHLCRAVLKSMVDGILLKYEAIEAIEKYWTGATRTTTRLISQADKFFAVVGCSYFISPNWHLVREFHVFAIAEDAWEDFAVFAALKSQLTTRPNLADVTDVVKLLDDLEWCAPMKDTLLLCLNRFCRVFSHQHNFGPEWSNGILHAIVNYTHSAFQKESPDARATFLRSSTSLEENSSRFREQHPPSFFVDVFGQLDLSDEGTILVHAGGSRRNRDRSSANICLYIVGQANTPPGDYEITRLVRQTYSTRDVYHSTRDNGPENFSLQTLAKWNLMIHKPVYGLCLEPIMFCNLLNTLGSDLPLRQGSPRISDGAMSGSYLYKRCFDPWRHHERIPITRNYTWSAEAQMLYVYKTVSTEVKYWKQIAVERQSHGLLSCLVCADVEDVVVDSSGLCEECARASKDTKIPRWLRRSILGQAPFRPERNKPKRQINGFPGPNSMDWDNALGDYRGLEGVPQDVQILYLQCLRFHDWYRSLVR
jgi:hypothetical protein